MRDRLVGMDWFPSESRYGPITYTGRAYGIAGGGYFGNLAPRGEKGRQWILTVTFVWDQQQQEVVHSGRIDAKNAAEAQAKAEKRIEAVVAEDLRVKQDPVRALDLATAHLTKILATCGKRNTEECLLNKHIASYLVHRWGMNPAAATELVNRMHPHRRLWNPRKLSMYRHPKGQKYRTRDIRPGARPPDAWDDIPKGSENFAYRRAAKRMAQTGWSREQIVEKLRTRWGLSLRDAEKTAAQMDRYREKKKNPSRSINVKITYRNGVRSVAEDYKASSAQDAEDHARHQMLLGLYAWADHAEVRIP